MQTANAQPTESLWPSVPREGIEGQAQAAHMAWLRQLADTGQSWELAVEMHRFAGSNVLDRRDIAIAGRMHVPEVHLVLARVESYNQQQRNQAARARFARAAPHLAA